MYDCFHCGAAAVVWDADFDTEDYGYEPGGIVHECHCASCGSLITYIVPSEIDDENETAAEEEEPEEEEPEEE